MFNINSELSAKVVKICDNQVIEIENFYQDPDEIREYALVSKKYTKEENPDLLAYATGRRVCEDTLELGFKVGQVFEDLCNHPGWLVEFDKEKHDRSISAMRFMVNVTSNKEILDASVDSFKVAHLDPPFLNWAVVVYLNYDNECEGGTGFYSQHTSNLIKLEHISEMKYNKAVLYPTNMFHGAIMEHGMFKDQDRLVQVMFL